jgi:hypothetical protein
MAVRRLIGQQVDRLALYALNSRIPENGADRFRCPVTLDEVIAQTHVAECATPQALLTTAGEHAIQLATRLGEIKCRVTVRPAADPAAPLFLYHHGLAEHPYTSSWRRLMPDSGGFPAHSVVVQAPYHTNMSDPIRIGFSSTEHLYQMLAGSLRIMQFMQEQFQEQGSPYTVVGGVSWGGITSLLYEGLFGASRAVMPLFASPRLSQAIWDAALLFNRDMPVSRAELDQLLDFTPIYESIDRRRVFPVLGEHDLFFRIENHAPIYAADSLLTLPVTHVGAMWRGKDRLQEHLLKALSWAADNPH